MLCRILCLLPALPFAIDAQSPRPAISVYVTQAASGEPVVGAVVAIVGTRHIARTDSFGHARLTDVAQTAHMLRVRALGFAEYNGIVTPDGSARADVYVQLRAAAVELDTVSTTARSTSPWLREFETRRLSGPGRYITASELRAVHGAELGSILLMKIPGLRQLRTGQVVATRGRNTLDGRSCVVAVFVDGIRVPTDKADEFPLSLIAGIEYYTPSTVPVRYKSAGRASACGTLLLWTGP